MMKPAGAVLALLAATVVAGASAQSQTAALQPFNTISVCLPYNIVIGPSSGQTYQLVVDADSGVASSINATVANGVLSLGLVDNSPNNLLFNAPNPIKVAVQLPANQLKSVAVSAVPSIVVAVAGGFTTSDFTASITGTSTLTVDDLTATTVEVTNGGTGALYIGGKIGTASVSSSGTGTTYIIGVSSSASVDASGISKVYISGTSTTQITGQVSGISSVFYDQGVCSVTSQFGGIFGSPCNQGKISPPSSLTNPQWSCALKLLGTFTCSDGSSGSSSSSSSGGGSSSSSSSSGGGTSFTSSTSNGVTTTSSGSSSADGTSQLTTGTGTLTVGTCNVTGNSLNIFSS